MPEKKINAGYEIINTMQIQNEFGTDVGLVLGYNENAPAAYVTWESNSNFDYFFQGHYFITKKAAIKDFFERGMHTAAFDYRSVYKNEVAREDIVNALELEYRKSDVADLVKNDSFLQQALIIHEDLEHSSKREALSESLTALYERMVTKHEIFDMDLLHKINQKEVFIESKDENFCGIAYVNTKDSLDCFYVECENILPENKNFKRCNISDIIKISCDNEKLFDKEHENSKDKKMDALDCQIAHAKGMLNGVNKEQHSARDILLGRE